MLECVVNISEGRDSALLKRLREVCGKELLDVHTDADHNRSVFTLIGTEAPRRLAAAACHELSLSQHQGVHPRIGVVDVVPFVPLGDSTMQDAQLARDEFAKWFAETHAIPVFLYGPERTLPSIRREAFTSLLPQLGPSQPHPTAGATAVGCRPVLVAWNIWLSTADVKRAKEIAKIIRSETVRTLGLQVGEHAQVSMNVIDPYRTDFLEIVNNVAAMAEIDHCELVGLAPDDVIARYSTEQQKLLDLLPSAGIFYRLQKIEGEN